MEKRDQTTYNIFKGNLIFELFAVFADVYPFILECTVSLLDAVQKTVFRIEIAEQRVVAVDRFSAPSNALPVLVPVGDSSQAQYALT